MAKIRVLVVEDSLTVRRRLCEILASDPGIELAGEAGDGRRAIEMCRELRPDIITLDMMLPIMSGLAATEYIMAHCPTPILIVSSSTNRGELFRTYEALAAGAVDVLEKPAAHETDGRWESKLVSTVKLVSRIRVITHPRGRLGMMGRRSTIPPLAPGASESPLIPAGAPADGRILALGTSTGGPAAIIQVLRALPWPYPMPILLIMHIGASFGAALAEWLDVQTPHRVTYACDGESLAGARGRVVMAPPDRHLIVRGNRLALTSDPERHSCRPSVDALFESLARACGPQSVACLLTGMGRDGAAGLLEIRKAGGLTIAQDEATSVVYGMPREAVLLGAAQHVLPLSDIGAALAGAARGIPEQGP